jgi:hypothetical protein
VQLASWRTLKAPRSKAKANAACIDVNTQIVGPEVPIVTKIDVQVLDPA